MSENIVPMCEVCSLAKGMFDPGSEVAAVGKIITNHIGSGTAYRYLCKKHMDEVCTAWKVMEYRINDNEHVGYMVVWPFVHLTTNLYLWPAGFYIDTTGGVQFEPYGSEVPKRTKELQELHTRAMQLANTLNHSQSFPQNLRALDWACEVCGKIATVAVGDCAEGAPVEGVHNHEKVLYRTWRPVGSAHYYCDEHERAPIKYTDNPRDGMEPPFWVWWRHKEKRSQVLPMSECPT